MVHDLDEVPLINGTLSTDVPLINGTSSTDVPLINGTSVDVVPLINGTSVDDAPLMFLKKSFVYSKPWDIVNRCTIN